MHLSLSAIARYDQFNGVLCWIVCDETAIFCYYILTSQKMDKMKYLTVIMVKKKKKKAGVCRLVNLPMQLDRQDFKYYQCCSSIMTNLLIDLPVGMLPDQLTSFRGWKR